MKTGYIPFYLQDNNVSANEDVKHWRFLVDMNIFDAVGLQSGLTMTMIHHECRSGSILAELFEAIGKVLPR